MTRSAHESRLVAALLFLGWASLGVTLYVSAPTAAMQLLALLALIPAGLSAVAGVQALPRPADDWPQRVLGLLAVVLTLALSALLGEPILANGRGIALPSAEVLYAGLAALTATVLYAGRHIIVGRGATLIAGVAVGLSVVMAGAAFAVAGPDDGASAECVVPRLADSSQVRVIAWAEVDGSQLGGARLEGERRGADERWTAGADGALSREGTIQFVRVGEQAWLREDDGRWSEMASPPGSGARRATLDGRLAPLLARLPLTAAEDLGLETVDGMAARRCRIAVDGTAAIEAFLPLAWLAGGEPLASDVRLDIWRGELDWWVGQEDRLRRASVIVGGLPADAWGVRGMRGRLHAEMSVDEPPAPAQIEEPLP